MRSPSLGERSVDVARLRDDLELVRKVGVDNCLFETDFPHPTSLYPIDNLEERLASLPKEDRAKVLCGNAARLLRLQANTTEVTMLWAIYCIDKPNSAALRAEHQERHSAYLKEKDPVIFFTGPLQSDDAGQNIGFSRS